MTAATQKTGTNRSWAFCAYGPAGSSADWVAFGAHATATAMRATRPRAECVFLRTFSVSPRADLRRAPKPGEL